ncbi:MAG TPA: pilus assembly PilX N-terminal domain-containing protein [Candidatus Dormibacteraeota bacterium]|nr:pilus assembly PilX N-terminal domain-containing protein [Candidatus Dormibacteraeota bacterium]
MKELRTKRRRKPEAGIVLLIAIFVLMLVSIVAIALILSAGTESALTSNYRSSAAVHYAAVAGLEEARGRLQPKNPDYFNNAVAGFMPTGGTPLALGQVRYIVNGGAVNPANPGDPFPDTEYESEFGAAPTPGNTQTTPSISGNNAAGIPGPLYKWVRINAVTETSLNLQVSSTNPNDSTTPLYYDSAHVDSHGVQRPSLIVSTTPPSTAVQAIEITSLAVLPNGSQKVLQNVVAPNLSVMQVPAALTMVGSGVSFSAPFSSAFYVDGNDHDVVGSCNPGGTPLTGLGYTTMGDLSGTNRPPMVSAHPGNYLGLNLPPPPPLPQPSVNDIATVITANLLDVTGLNKVVHDLGQIADATSGTTSVSDAAPGPFAGMSPSTPKTIVVNGDLTVSGWNNIGYGLLVVTGNLNFDSAASWRGLILVIGQGKFTSASASGGTGDIRGGILLAKILDSTGAQLPAPAASSYIQTGNGTGVYYSSCWIKAAQQATGYKVLSFRELPQ